MLKSFTQRTNLESRSAGLKDRVETDFVWIAAWDRQAELCGQYLAKGKRVAVDGYLRSRSWEEEGKRRREIEVVARSVEFLSPATEEGGEVVPFEPAVA